MYSYNCHITLIIEDFDCINNIIQKEIIYIMLNYKNVFFVYIKLLKDAYLFLNKLYIVYNTHITTNVSNALGAH